MPTPRRRLSAGADGPLRAAFAAIRADHDVPRDFAPEVLAEAADVQDLQPVGRVDLTDVPFVTVDPPGSRDLDQAMHLARTPFGYRVRYAIADVGALVRPGGALDAAAHERVVTMYCPDERVPLHPTSLSEDAGSLLPEVDRLAVVWDLALDREGELRDVVVRRAVVRSRARLDYPGLQRRLDDGGDPDDLPRLLAEVGTARAALERTRGGVSLARPEQEVVEAPGGGWRLEYRAPLAVEEHNEQVSLLTGMAAARLMLDAVVGVLRTLPPARADDVTDRKSVV